MYNEPWLTEEQQNAFFESVKKYTLDLTVFQNPLLFSEITAKMAPLKIKSLKWRTGFIMDVFLNQAIAVLEQHPEIEKMECSVQGSFLDTFLQAVIKHPGLWELKLGVMCLTVDEALPLVYTWEVMTSGIKVTVVYTDHLFTSTDRHTVRI